MKARMKRGKQMRLIDADELIKSFLDHNRTEFEIKNCCMANENVIAIITNAPALVPEPINLYKKRALTLVDELREKGAINVREMGTLRRAILERSVKNEVN